MAVSAAVMLAGATKARLSEIAGLAGIFDVRPWQASHPFAIIDADAETDWSHKSGQGREIRLSIAIHDNGERPDRLRRLIAAAQAEMAAIETEPGDWRIVSFAFLRSRIAANGRNGWIGRIDYRVRMLAPPG